MSRRPWTDADTARLRELAGQGQPMSNIARRMGRNSRHILRRATRHGIEVRRVCVKQPWSAADDQALRQLYPTHTAQAIADRLGKTLSSVNNRAGKLGLSKPPGYVSDITKRRWREGRHENSRKACFYKGHDTWNKGKKGWQAGGRSVDTQFKKGNMSGAAQYNYVPLGTTRVTCAGQLERKVTDDPSIVSARRWVAVSRLVWEVAHGPIPPSHVVHFKDGMHTVIEDEITADKLECISMRENMLRNSFHRYPQPIPQLIQLRGALTRKINNREKDYQKQDRRSAQSPVRRARGLGR